MRGKPLVFGTLTVAAVQGILGGLRRLAARGAANRASTAGA